MTEAVEALAGRMEALLASMDGEPARFFLGTYLRTTRAVEEALARGSFEDPGWVAAWVVDFADRYLAALRAWQSGVPGVLRPWRAAFDARPGLPPEAHVLLGMNAHINYDLPPSLLAMIPPAEFADPHRLEGRRRDHERIDGILASRVANEDVALQRAGGRRTPLDRLIAPANRYAARTFLAEARRKVWHNAGVLESARRRGDDEYASRLADLERASADRVGDLLRPGPVLLRLAVRGFGVTIGGG